jgi:sRNA-binding protein
MTKDELQQRYPGAFSSPPRPLAIGITKQIYTALPDISRIKLKALMSWYVRQYPYLIVVAAGGNRYDLDGIPTGSVSDAERLHAQLHLVNGYNTFDAAAEYRKRLLLRFDSEHMTPDEFAHSNNIPINDLIAILNTARYEQRTRQHAREMTVKAVEVAACSIEEFAHLHNISAKALQKTITKTKRGPFSAAEPAT